MIKNLIIAGLSFLCIALIAHSLRMSEEWTKLVGYYGYAEKFIEEAEKDWNGNGMSFYATDAGLDYVHASGEIKSMLEH